MDPHHRLRAAVRSSPGWRLLVGFSGLGALFSGAAVLTNIVAGVSLSLALLVIATLVCIGIGGLLARTSGARRRALTRLAMAGAAAGLVGTLCYDGAKFGLSLIDPSPYNPFEATRVFGLLLVGSESHPFAVPVGWGFHLLNGTSFGVAYGLLFSRSGQTSIAYAVSSGVAWGLFLVAFQLLLYPDWLGIAFVREFQQISAAAHIVYGAVLGVMTRAALRGGFAPRRVQRADQIPPSNRQHR